MSVQDIEQKGLNQEENKKLSNIEKNVSNRITIESIPYKEPNQCCLAFQNVSDSKKQQCQVKQKCKYDNPAEIHQNVELLLNFDGDKTSFSDWEINKKIIDTFKDNNYSKDTLCNGRFKIKIHTQYNELKKEDLDIIIKQKYQKFSHLLEQSKNFNFIPIQILKEKAIILQDFIDNIQNGDNSVCLYFSQFQQQYETIHYTLQFIQQANIQEIEVSSNISQNELNVISNDINSQQNNSLNMCNAKSNDQIQNSQLNISQNKLNKYRLKKDQIRITLISILKYQIEFQPNQNENLQCINLFYDSKNNQKHKQTNKINYDVFIDETFESLKVALKYFIKEKLLNFKPNIIIFQFQISSSQIVDPLIFYKLTKAFNKISQGKLIIIPFIDKSNFHKESEKLSIQQVELCYQKCVNSCFKGCLKKPKEKVKIIGQDLTIAFFEKLHSQFCENAAIKKMYQSQLRALRIQKRKEETEEKSNFLTREFPLIDSDGNLSILDLQFEFNPQTCQYFVEYNKIEIEEYDGIVILIDDHVIYIITFKEQDQLNKKVGQKTIIKQKTYQIPLPNKQIKKNVYYFDIDKLQLMSFFGYDKTTSQFCSEIYTIQIFSQQQQWQKIQITSKQRRNQKSENFIDSSDDLLKIISKRKNFTVTQNSIDGFETNNCYLCLGGSFHDELVQYGCIIQEIQIDTQKQVYTTKIIQKQKVDKFYKECSNPLIMRMNQTFLIYFEGDGNYYNTNLNPSIYKIALWKQNNYLILNNKVTIVVDDKNVFQQFYKYFKSNQKNIRQICLEQQVENLFAFKLLLYDPETFKNQKFNKKDPFTKFHIITFQFTQDCKYMNAVRIAPQQFLMKEEKPFKSIKDLMEKYPEELFQNSVENLMNNFIFNLNEIQSQYVLCYLDISRTITFKRFKFQDNDTQENVFDYHELVIQEHFQQKIYILRKNYIKNSCKLCLFECPNINFQDIKDMSSNENIEYKVPIVLKYIVQDFKDTHQLIGFNIESKEIDSFEATILTNKNLIKITNKKGQFTQSQSKIQQKFSLNLQHNFIFFKTYLPDIQFCLFYSLITIKSAIVNKIQQNILEIKYTLLNEKGQFINNGKLVYIFNDPLSINGCYDGKINTIRNISDERIEIQILINQDDNITYEIIHCQINKKSQELELLKFNNKNHQKYNGCQILTQIQNNLRFYDYLTKKQGGKIELCSE